MKRSKNPIKFRIRALAGGDGGGDLPRLIRADPLDFQGTVTTRLDPLPVPYRSTLGRLAIQSFAAFKGIQSIHGYLPRLQLPILAGGGTFAVDFMCHASTVTDELQAFGVEDNFFFVVVQSTKGSDFEARLRDTGIEAWTQFFGMQTIRVTGHELVWRRHEYFRYSAAVELSSRLEGA